MCIYPLTCVCPSLAETYIFILFGICFLVLFYMFFIWYSSLGDIVSGWYPVDTFLSSFTDKTFNGIHCTGCTVGLIKTWTAFSSQAPGFCTICFGRLRIADAFSVQCCMSLFCILWSKLIVSLDWPFGFLQRLYTAIITKHGLRQTLILKS